MARRHHYRRAKENPELNVTTFLNLMVVLIPFLLISAVFSRVTIMELSVPTGAGGPVADQPAFNIEVIIRGAGFELADGSRVGAAIPKIDDEYDYKKLTEILTRLKATYPEKEDAIILLEPGIEYDNLIQTMDRVRSAEIKAADREEIQRMVLFPAISIGDAP
jgi:biopolymer transport protein ExbD